MENELFFVGIRDPIELRKELLLSSKNLIDSLRRYEAYKTIKDQKLRQIIQLKRVFDELLVLNKKFRGKLPRVPVKTPSVEREEPKPRSAPSRLKPSAKTKMEMLEEELAKVESRLGSLE
ncbi:MAG TPA: hypothetical protein VI612_03570 [Candidatus Nanoarchaeia archaeon]|nr:hypothetical protein [Candidatus Nanoarchaeia archaeon]